MNATIECVVLKRQNLIIVLMDTDFVKKIYDLSWAIPYITGGFS